MASAANCYTIDLVSLAEAMRCEIKSLRTRVAGFEGEIVAHDNRTRRVEAQIDDNSLQIDALNEVDQDKDGER